MSEKAREFVDGWIAENVHATGYEPEGDATEAKRLAFECWAAADKAGIPRGQIEQAVGPLVDHMAAAIEEVNDAEVRRLAARDD